VHTTVVWERLERQKKPRTGISPINDCFLKICFDRNAKAQGFGLGAVKRLTETLNGSVTPKNEIGTGTKFDMEFPF
jgi:sensor histidine kinase regulating citrate/malate metabolism